MKIRHVWRILHFPKNDRNFKILYPHNSKSFTSHLLFSWQGRQLSLNLIGPRLHPSLAGYIVYGTSSPPLSRSGRFHSVNTLAQARKPRPILELNNHQKIQMSRVGGCKKTRINSPQEFSLDS